MLLPYFLQSWGPVACTWLLHFPPNGSCHVTDAEFRCWGQRDSLVFFLSAVPWVVITRPLGIYTSEISSSLFNVAGISEALVRGMGIEDDYVVCFFISWKLEEMNANLIYWHSVIMKHLFWGERNYFQQFFFFQYAINTELTSGSQLC